MSGIVSKRTKISRRELLKTLALTAGAVALASCGATPTATAVPVPPTATKAPVPPTAVPPTAVPPTAVPPTATKAAAPAAPAATTAPAAPVATAVPAAPTAAPVAIKTTGAAPVPGEDYSKAARKDTLILDDDSGRVADPFQCNPYVPGARTDQGPNEAMIEPLQILNYETAKYELWLAESITSNATLDVWTVKLRKGITWSDGIAMNADDVVFTFQLILKTTGWSVNATLVPWIKDVTKVDDLTTQITLTKPNPRFSMDYLSHKTSSETLKILPKHIWDGQDPLTFKNYDKAKGWPVWSGQYKFFSGNETDFVYVRDDNWWGYKSGFSPLAFPKKLEWVVPGPEETRTALMASGQLDVLGDITYGAFTALQAKNPNVQAWFPKLPFASRDPAPRNLEFNCAVAPWNDKDMRWAINYVIDRDQVVSIAYEGTTVKAFSFFPDYNTSLKHYTDLIPADTKTKYITTNTKAAADILTAKGYVKKGNYYQKDGKDLSLEIQTHEAYIELQRIADLVAEQLQKFGINAVTKRTASAAFGDNWQLGNFESRLGWHTNGSISEPWFSMDTMTMQYIKPIGERANFGWRWSNKAYSDLVAQIGVLPLLDPKIDDLFKQAMAIYYDEVPVVTIAQAKKLVPVDFTYWKNWPTSTNNYMQPFMWWSSAHMMWPKLLPAK